MSLFHSNTEQLIDYWRSLTGDGARPGRRGIDPSAFPKLAPQAFLLSRDQNRVRLAGDLVGLWHGADLRGRDYLSLWRTPDRAALRTALDQAHRRGRPVVARATAQAGSARMRLEILFAPVAGDDGGPDRLLGLCQPLEPISALGEAAIDSLALAELTDATAEGPPRLRLAALDGRAVA